MQSSERDMDVQPEATPAPTAQPLPQPLFRFDPGWPFVVAGLGLLVCAVLIPAQRDLQQLRNTLEVHRALEDQSLRRLEAYDRFLADLDKNDEQLVRRLAASQLNLMPKEQRSVLLTSSVNATVTDWIDASEPLELPTPEPYPDTLLARLATGPRRLWVLACGVFLVFIGLLLGPSNPTASRRSVRAGAGSLGSEHPVAGGAEISAAAVATSVLDARSNPDASEPARPEAEAASVADATVAAIGDRSSLASAPLESASVEAIDPDASSDEFVQSVEANPIATTVEPEAVFAQSEPTSACEPPHAAMVDAAVEAAGEAETCEIAPMEASEVETSEVETSEVETSEVETSEVETSEVETFEVEASEVEASEVEASEVEASEVEASEVEASEVEASEDETCELAPVDEIVDDGAVSDADIRDEECLDEEVVDEHEELVDEHIVEAAIVEDGSFETEDSSDEDAVVGGEQECDAGDEIARAESRTIPGEIECEHDAELPSANDRALDSLSLFHGLSDDRWVDTRDPRG